MTRVKAADLRLDAIVLLSFAESRSEVVGTEKVTRRSVGIEADAEAA
ncbi:MAG TPA: hypothetical protein VIW03_09985 [Anaeromyxobacter sp.]